MNTKELSVKTLLPAWRIFVVAGVITGRFFLGGGNAYSQIRYGASGFGDDGGPRQQQSFPNQGWMKQWNQLQRQQQQVQRQAYQNMADGIAKGLDNLQRNLQRQNETRRYEPRQYQPQRRTSPYPQQRSGQVQQTPRQYYYRPQQRSGQVQQTPRQNYRPQPRTIAPSSSEPKPVAVPKNVIPAQPPSRETLKLTANSLPTSGLRPMPTDRVDALTGELNSHLKSDFEAFQADFQDAMDAQLEAMFDDPYFTFSTNLPPEVADAMKAGNFEHAKELVADAGLKTKDMLKVFEAIDDFEETRNLATDLEDGLRSGLTLEQLQPTMDAITKVLNRQPRNPAVESLQQSAFAGLTRIERSLRIEQQLKAGPPAVGFAGSLFSKRPILVLYDPNLERGQRYLAGPELVVIHSEDGTFRSTETPLADALQVPVGAESPAPEVGEAYSASKIRLLNPPEYGSDISFQIANRNHSLASGKEMSVSLSERQAIVFNNGRDKTLRFTIWPGTYEFRLEKEGWKLYRVSYSTTIDNTHGVAAFHFVFEDEQKTVDPGSTIELKSDFPIVVRFDKGNGEAPAQRKLSNGVYSVAIDRSKGQWDLFAKVEVVGEVTGKAVADRPSGEVEGRESVGKPRWAKQ